ncbi:predicted protein [Thalassiosira pseudonana CCMP1335]|uniref:KOW domain-containing protein n=1 Tax=Thalassiosira pseudonana TaxID=35128 RepID=B8CEM9_THAPS|nr:predicted protein [Thalassiosira pseudonana CCMP1335]EED87930.1 predicted protein [Thalassiosira pseudonana CCMP1335]
MARTVKAARGRKRRKSNNNNSKRPQNRRIHSNSYLSSSVVKTEDGVSSDDDNDDDDAKDDSSFSDASSSDEEDDDDDDDDTEKKPSSSSNKRPRKNYKAARTSTNINMGNNVDRNKLLNAKVRVTLGTFKGEVGRIKKVNASGWCYLSGNGVIDAPVRFGDVEVIEYEDESVPQKEETVMKRGSPSSLVDATVRVIGGKYEGVEGVVEDVNARGWFSIGDRKFRVGDVEVISYPTTTTADGDATVAEVDAQDKYMGALVRITTGPFEGMEGTIKERTDQTFFKLREIPGKIVSFDDVKLIHLAKKRGRPAHDLKRRYADATVRVTKGEHEGVECKVLSVITGKWYFTDNPNIGGAHKASTFQVVRYADGSKPSDDELADVASDSEEDEKMDDVDDSRDGLRRSSRDSAKTAQDDSNSEGSEERVKKEYVSDDGDDNEEADADDVGAASAEKKRSPPNRGQAGSPKHKVEKDDDGNESADDKKPSSASALIGLTASCTKGMYKGLTARIVRVFERGWWELDHPDITSKVNSCNCCFINDEHFDKEKVEEYYMSRSSLSRMPLIINPREEVTGDAGVAETAMDEDGSNDSDNEMLATSASKRCASAANERLEPDRFKQKIAETDFTGAVEKSVDMLSLRNRGMSERQTSVTWGAQSVASFAVPNVPAEHFLRLHSMMYRAGRSGSDVRVSSSVVPQSRVRQSTQSGTRVSVTGGEYQGLTGVVQSCLPGGWYIVSKLFRRDKMDLDAVIKSENLKIVGSVEHEELLPVGIEDTNKARSLFSIHLKAAKLRLEVLNEEREKILMNEAPNTGSSEKKRLRKIEFEIKKTKSKIVAFELVVKNRDADNASPAEALGVENSDDAEASPAEELTVPNTLNASIKGPGTYFPFGRN